MPFIGTVNKIFWRFLNVIISRFKSLKSIYQLKAKFLSTTKRFLGTPFCVDFYVAISTNLLGPTSNAIFEINMSWLTSACLRARRPCSIIYSRIYVLWHYSMHVALHCLLIYYEYFLVWCVHIYCIYLFTNIVIYFVCGNT